MKNNDNDEILKRDEKWKKNSEHTHTSQHTSQEKCCNITTTVNNASNYNHINHI